MDLKVSIIIPTYKRSEFLVRAIESVLNQTYSNIEILVVDDNDPNSNFRIDTEKKMGSYCYNDKVKYIKNKKNLGGAFARNEGIFKATGDFITFLDDDDEYLKVKVERQLKFMIDNNCDMSFTDLRYVNEKKIIVDYREFHYIQSFDKNSLLKHHIMRQITGTPTFMYRAEKLKEIGGFDNVKMGQEFYLMIKSIQNDLVIRYMEGCDLLAYRHNSGCISSGVNKINGENELYEFKKKYNHLFSLQERMFIRFRHYAIMVVAYKRNRNYIKMVMSGIVMFVASPIDFFKEITNFISKIIRFRKVKEHMNLQVLASTMNQLDHSLLEKMNIQSDTIIVNQCDKNEFENFRYKGYNIKILSLDERGVGLSRNTALMRATSDICIFADDDVRYDEGYKEIIIKTFKENPKADIILFNLLSTNSERPLYPIPNKKRVRFYNCLKYGSVRIAARTERLKQANVYFSLLFGGGAKYSSGEDSLFLFECINKRLKVFRSPKIIGCVSQEGSTWFEGYTDKFFIDKGVFYYFLSPRWTKFLCLQYVIRHRKMFGSEKNWRDNFRLMIKGIKMAKESKK